MRQLVLLSLACLVRLCAAELDCVSCHDEKAGPFQASVHATLKCTGCHSDITAFPHPENSGKVNCGTCHADNAADVAASVHAKAGVPQACIGCHGEPHGILTSKDAASSTYATNLPRTCGTCHSKSFPDQRGKQIYAQYLDSIHGMAVTKQGLLVAANCSSCHGTHKILASRDPQSRTNHANIPSTCGACHQGPLTAYRSGIHGQKVAAGNTRAPVCSDCHTAHQIARVETAEWQMKTTATCGRCHVQQLRTYHDTFHAQVSALGYVDTAHCWDCHGFHDILPASNPKSTVARANLITTCGKCHSGANRGFVTYEPHADRHNAQAYPLLHFASVFMNLLLSGVLGLFVLHTILWLIRSTAEHRAARAERINP